MQFDQSERGFSFQRDGPLDMRMDPTATISAKQVINSLSEKELGQMFKDLGEERFWRKAAKAIVDERKKRPIETTKQLSDVIESVISRGGQKIHPATRIFQAIRIFVNKELETIEIALKNAVKLLNPEGVVGVLTFHSLEDRIVKNVFRDLASPIRNLGGQKISEAAIENLLKKPLIPTREETKTNPRARSAKLRFIRRKAQDSEARIQ